LHPSSSLPSQSLSPLSRRRQFLQECQNKKEYLQDPKLEEAIETGSSKSRGEEENCSLSLTKGSTDTNSMHGASSVCTKFSSDEKSEKDAVLAVFTKLDKLPKTSADESPHLKWEPLKIEGPSKATAHSMLGTRVESQTLGNQGSLKTVSKEKMADNKADFFVSAQKEPTSNEEYSHFEPTKISSRESLTSVDKYDFFASIQKESASKDDDSFWEETKYVRPSSTRMTGIRGEISRTSNLGNPDHIPSRRGSLRYGSPKLERAEGSQDVTDPFVGQHNNQPVPGGPLHSSRMSLTTASSDRNESVLPLSPISTQRALLKTAVLQKGKLPTQFVPSSDPVPGHKSDCTPLSLTAEALASHSVKVK